MCFRSSDLAERFISKFGKMKFTSKQKTVCLKHKDVIRQCLLDEDQAIDDEAKGRYGTYFTSI